MNKQTDSTSELTPQTGLRERGGETRAIHAGQPHPTRPQTKHQAQLSEPPYRGTPVQQLKDRRQALGGASQAVGASSDDAGAALPLVMSDNPDAIETAVIAGVCLVGAVLVYVACYLVGLIAG